MIPFLLSQPQPIRPALLSLLCQRTMASIQNAPARPRRFAPLRDRSAQKPDVDAPVLQGIVFDVDGTLCLPQHYMFAQMRAALGIDKSTDILDHIRGLPTEDDRTEAVAKIQAIEREAMLSQQPQPGLLNLMDYLERKKYTPSIVYKELRVRPENMKLLSYGKSILRKIYTLRAPVTHLLKNHLPNHIFEPIVTRDTPDLLPKPEPSGLLHIGRQWGLENRAESMIMVGDSIDDMTAGHTAGAATVLLVNERNTHLREHVHTDLCISRLDDLIDILENGFVGDNCAGSISN